MWEAINDKDWGPSVVVSGETRKSIGGHDVPVYVAFKLDSMRLARLIAAAPDLLAALRVAQVHVLATTEAQHMMDGFGPRTRQPSDATLEQVNAAIAKAEGGSGKK